MRQAAQGGSRRRRRTFSSVLSASAPDELAVASPARSSAVVGNASCPACSCSGMTDRAAGSAVSPVVSAAAAAGEDEAGARGLEAAAGAACALSCFFCASLSGLSVFALLAAAALFERAASLLLAAGGRPPSWNVDGTLPLFPPGDPAAELEWPDIVADSPETIRS